MNQRPLFPPGAFDPLFRIDRLQFISGEGRRLKQEMADEDIPEDVEVRRCIQDRDEETGTLA